MESPQHHPRSTTDLNYSSFSSDSSDDLCNDQNGYYYPPVKHEPLFLDQNFPFNGVNGYPEYTMPGTWPAESQYCPPISMSLSFPAGIGLDAEFEPWGPTEYVCPSQNNGFHGFLPPELAFTTNQQGPDETGGFWEALGLLGNIAADYRPATSVEPPLHSPEHPSNSGYTSSPNTLDTSTLLGSTPERRIQEITPSPVACDSLDAETSTVVDCGISENESRPVVKQVVAVVKVSKPRGRQSARKEVNTVRRQAKINRRSQALHGGNFDVFDSVEGRNSRHPRANFSETRRKEVAAVRRRGACFRCKLWKKKCDLNSTCSNCEIGSGCDKRSGGITDQPCFRLDLSDCGFFRTKSAMWTQPLRETEGMAWLSDDAIPLVIQCIYHNGNGPQFTINCRRFKPEETDVVSRKWGPAATQTLRIPTYCAMDLKSLRNQIPLMVWYYCNNVTEAISGSETGGIPTIVAKTFKLAMARQENEPLLKAAVEIWAGSRFIAAPRSLRGNQTLGLSPIQDKSAHDCGNIPIPPMLDYQLDTLAIQRMEKTMNDMLKKLWKTLQAHSKKSWFDVFLIIFILVNNLEYVYEAQLQYAQEHGSDDPGRETFRLKIRKTSEKMLEHWDWTARHLIFVFKYHIKRCAFEGAPLFSDEFVDQAAKDGDLDEPAIKYLKDMVVWIKGIDAEAPSGSQVNRGYQTRWCRELVLDQQR